MLPRCSAFATQSNKIDFHSNMLWVDLPIFKNRDNNISCLLNSPLLHKPSRRFWGQECVAADHDEENNWKWKRQSTAERGSWRYKNPKLIKLIGAIPDAMKIPMTTKFLQRFLGLDDSACQIGTMELTPSTPIPSTIRSTTSWVERC